MTSTGHWIAAFCLGMAATFPKQSTAQACDAVLAEGVFNSFQSTDNTAIYDSFHHTVCSNRTRNIDWDSTFGISLPLPDLASAFGFSSGNQITRESVDSFCDSGGQIRDYQAAVRVVQSVASPDIVNAWSDCIARHGGLTCEAAPLGGGQFSVTVSWRRQNTGAGTEAAVIEGAPQLANATCPAAPIQAGASVPDTSSLTEFCRFLDPTIPATVALNTSQGSVTCTATPESTPLSAEGVAEACVGGDGEACLEMIRLSRQAIDVCERTGQDNFALYINCGNARVGIADLQIRVAGVDRACWRQTADCGAARQALAVVADQQAQLVTAILSGGGGIVQPPFPLPSPVD